MAQGRRQVERWIKSNIELYKNLNNPNIFSDQVLLVSIIIIFEFGYLTAPKYSIFIFDSKNWK